MKALVIISGIAFICASQAPAATPEHLAKINKFFELTRMQEQYEANLTMGMTVSPQAILRGWMPEEERGKMDKTLQRARDLLVNEAGWSKAKADLAELYAQRYSEAEMDAILKILDNETGRMLYAKQAELVPETAAYAQRKFQALGPQLMAILSESALKRAQSINCVNNLKQIGLAFMVWAVDNQDRFPFQVSTNKGGTLERCSRAGDGSDGAAYFHFQVMSNELTTPKLLVCPADAGKKAALNFLTLETANVSYVVFSSPEVAEEHPEEVLGRCPVHGHVLRCDGSVQQRK